MAIQTRPGILTPNQCIKLLADGCTSIDVVGVLKTHLEAHCHTETEGDGGTTTLYDWLYEGSYTGDETLESLAREWDELTPPTRL